MKKHFEFIDLPLEFFILRCYEQATKATETIREEVETVTTQHMAMEQLYGYAIDIEVVLDEAASAIDPKTQELVQKMIMGGFPGSTLIAIAHRLETVLDFDKITALEHGRVKEVGAPKQLEDDPSSMFARVLAGAYRPPADPGRPQIRHIGGSQHTCAPCTVAVAAEQRDSETSTEDDSPNEASSRVESAAATWGDADQCVQKCRMHCIYGLWLLAGGSPRRRD